VSDSRLSKISEKTQQKVALNIFTLREQLELSQSEVAERAGIDRKTVNRIENERFSPSIDTLTRISVALGVNVSDLLM
jgi:transcriptional regulator with XRE-family HTH domain